jgi:pyruvate kinase
MKKTKIIATVWPASESEEKLIWLYEAWVNIMRFNFSHANYENAKKIKERINALNLSGKTNLSTLLDTKWPEIRTWDLDEKRQFAKWDKIKLYVDKSKATDSQSLYCDYEYLVTDLEVWDTIEIDSGLLKTLVTAKKADYIEVEALSDCLIWSRRHINLPWKKIKLPWITDKDKEDVLFAIENWYDFIAQSFVRTAGNVLELRELLSENNASHVKIIAKIENDEWVENLDEIIAVTDWIMVARWDLWIETPIEMLPIYQRRMVKKCLENWKFVIIATQLLETMMDNPFPTRAEVSDVFNSVMQKADCLMLSGETAMWKYPVETVKTMSNIVREAEKQMHYKHQDFSDFGLSDRDLEKKHLIRSSIFMADDMNVDAIIIFTKSWRLARLAAGFRPTKNVFAFTGINNTLGYLNILFWIKWYSLENWSPVYKDNLKSAMKLLIWENKLTNWSKVIVITDLQKDNIEIPVLEIINISDFMNAYWEL